MVHFLISSSSPRVQNSSSAAVSWKNQLLLDVTYHKCSVSRPGSTHSEEEEALVEKFLSILWCPSSPENQGTSSVGFLSVDKSALSYQQIATSGRRGGSAQRLETSGAGTCSSEEMYVLQARAVNSTVAGQQPDIFAEFRTLSSPIVPLASAPHFWVYWSLTYSWLPNCTIFPTLT